MIGTIWLALIIIFLVIEIATVGLTSIWLAGGALVAFLLSLCNVGVVWQIVAFFGVSIVLMVFTRPFAKRFINKDRTKTNYEEIIGSLVKVTELIDNLNGQGAAIANGQEWTARAKNPKETFEEGELVRVVDIMGVKLIVERETSEK